MEINRQLKKVIVNILIQNHNVQADKAEKMVDQSTFAQLLNSDPLYAMNSTVHWWVNDILEENKINKLV